jgi:hypothetical protein
LRVTAIRSGVAAEYLSHAPRSRRISMAETQHPSGVSRRKALLTGAGLVAAGAVAGATGGLVTAQLADGGLAAPKGNPKVPVMVHLRDAHAGQFDVFFGDSKVTIVDTSFAARLVRAADAA